MKEISQQSQDTSQPASQPASQPGTKAATQLHGALICKALILILILFMVVFVLAMFRTTLLGILTYNLSRLCEANSTQMNSLNCTVIPDETENSSRYFRVTDLLYVIYSFLNLPEYAALAYGLYQLRVKILKWRSSNISSIKDDLTKLFNELSKENLKVWLGVIAAFAFIILFILISLAAPILGIINTCTNKCNPGCNKQQMVLSFRVIYEVLTILAHLLSSAIRAAMVITVLEVRVIWLQIEPDTTGEGSTPNDEMKAITDHYNRVNNYKQRIRKIKPLIRVFQTWFVFQWFHYFFQAITNLSRTLHPWITGTHHAELIIAYRGMYTVYDILAFIIPHVCGLKINAYHEQYLRHERKKQLKKEKIGSKRQHAKAYTLPIEKIKYGDFVPEIRGTGIKIPLENTGYTLSILLTIFALAASFMSFNM